MKLIVEDVDLSTGGPLIAVIHEEDAEKLGVFALDRIRIKKGKKEVVAIVNISESRDRSIKGKGVRSGEVGLFEEVLDILKVKDGEVVNVEYESIPKSLQYIKKKLRNGGGMSGKIGSMQDFKSGLSVVKIGYGENTS